MEKLVKEMLNLGVLQIGEFTLKSGEVSPFYVDLRLIPSAPSLFAEVIDRYVEVVKDIGVTFDAIAGIMSAGVPFATGIALKLTLPLIQIRAEVKDHGTKKMVEGIIPPPGSKILLVDDLISTGVSKLQPKKTLQELGLEVSNLVVFLDRMPKDNQDIIDEMGLRLYSVMKIPDLLNILVYMDDIDDGYKANIIRSLEQWDQKSTKGVEEDIS